MSAIIQNACVDNMLRYQIFAILLPLGKS